MVHICWFSRISFKINLSRFLKLKILQFINAAFRTTAFRRSFPVGYTGKSKWRKNWLDSENCPATWECRKTRLQHLFDPPSSFVSPESAGKTTERDKISNKVHRRNIVIKRTPQVGFKPADNMKDYKSGTRWTNPDSIQSLYQLRRLSGMVWPNDFERSFLARWKHLRDWSEGR